MSGRARRDDRANVAVLHHAVEIATSSVGEVDQCPLDDLALARIAAVDELLAEHAFEAARMVEREGHIGFTNRAKSLSKIRISICQVEIVLLVGELCYLYQKAGRVAKMMRGRAW